MSGELEKLILGDIDVEINPSESTEERDVYQVDHPATRNHKPEP